MEISLADLENMSTELCDSLPNRIAAVRSCLSATSSAAPQLLCSRPIVHQCAPIARRPAAHPDRLRPPPPQASASTWTRFESEVRAAHAVALSRLRLQGSERCAELVRLLEIEEQTRCQAFQAVLMSEVRPLVYQRTVRSIIEKLLAKLETWS